MGKKKQNRDKTNNSPQEKCIDLLSDAKYGIIADSQK